MWAFVSKKSTVLLHKILHCVYAHAYIFFINSQSGEWVGHFYILTARGRATVNLELLTPV